MNRRLDKKDSLSIKMKNNESNIKQDVKEYSGSRIKQSIRQL